MIIKWHQRRQQVPQVIVQSLEGVDRDEASGVFVHHERRQEDQVSKGERRHDAPDQ